MSEEVSGADWLPSDARPLKAEEKPKSFWARLIEMPEPNSQKSDSAAESWEHKTIRVPGRNRRKDHDRALNKMTAQGWELVSVNWGGLLRGTDTATFRRLR